MRGIIAGTGFHKTGFLGETTEKTIETPYGDAYSLLGKGFMFIQRHGKEMQTPPHMLNHRANIYAFKQMGIDTVIALTSVGSMKKAMPPGSIVIPDDYMQLSNIPTFNDVKALHATPGLDRDLRREIISAARRLEIKAIHKGVYLQTTGPRLETKAEINFFRRYADIIGMTMASEATLANEIGIKYAAISLVDNYAHGIGNTPLDFSKVAKASAAQRDDLKKLIKEVIGHGDRQ